MSSRSNLALLDCAYYGRFCQWDKRPALCPVPEIGRWMHDRDCEITVKGKTYKIKRGDQTDLGTIPFIARPFISVADPYFVLGFIWHDATCGQYGEPQCSWSEANKILYWINKEMSQHLGWWARCKRHLVFVAVELNGLIKGHY